MTAPEPVHEGPPSWELALSPPVEGLRLRMSCAPGETPPIAHFWTKVLTLAGSQLVMQRDGTEIDEAQFVSHIRHCIAQIDPGATPFAQQSRADRNRIDIQFSFQKQPVAVEVTAFPSVGSPHRHHQRNILRLAQIAAESIFISVEFTTSPFPIAEHPEGTSNHSSSVHIRADISLWPDRTLTIFSLIVSPNPSAPPLHALTLSDLIGAQPIALAPIAPRLNLITGDNGLGKSFLLDTAWWSLTGTWAGPQALPEASDGADPTIAAQIDLGWGPLSSVHRWNPAQQGWSPASSTEDTPLRPKALVVYAQTNNRFALWDPARSGQTRRDRSGVARTIPPLYRFSEREVLDGIQSEDPAGQSTSRLCLGLIDEWREWQQMGDARFQRFQAILAALGPDDGGAPVVPGALRRLYFDDARAIPTLRLPHGEEVPILFAPAGYRRMAMLAYLLTWAVNEHENACRFLQRPPAHHLVLLIDEPETHLHPRWQRSILRGLRAAIAAAGGDRPLQAQILLVTHAPLLLASAEPHFDPAQDALWKLDLAVEPSARPPWSITVTRDAWRRRGSADAWLTSDVFDLQEAQSQEAERAIAEARRLIREEVREPTALQAATAALEAALSPEDRLLDRWRWHLRRLDTPP